MILMLGAEVSAEYAKMRQSETAPKAAGATSAPRPGPVMVAPPQAPPLTQRALAVGGAAVASVAAFLAVLGTRRPSGHA
jgi:hypothetical protein